ncbi:hypothetical protein SCHPADRAFT_321532 [Schizopora paradoxa]|uniref:Uncharacterized protein n=1 Tax=Schizopora paradoxa TaxID=27342 RepID=A0A0H2RRM3_9AGAM|nr:hypothetical protein SCHPADRAFT_321532 [Schizopora paradoxa]
MSASASSSHLRASSAQSDDVNITIDSGDTYPEDGSYDLPGAFGDAGMTGSQHNSSYLRLDPLPQLPVPFSPTHHSPLHLQESSYQATHTQRYPTTQAIPGAPLHHNSSLTSAATFGNLSSAKDNLHAVHPQESPYQTFAPLNRELSLQSYTDLSLPLNPESSANNTPHGESSSITKNLHAADTRIRSATVYSDASLRQEEERQTSKATRIDD